MRVRFITRSIGTSAASYDPSAIRRPSNDRVPQRERLLPQICALIQSFTRDEIVAKLDGSGVPFAPIMRPEDLFEDEHLVGSGRLERVRLPSGHETMLPILPIEFSDC